jgi:hypothetical protein
MIGRASWPISLVPCIKSCWRGTRIWSPKTASRKGPAEGRLKLSKADRVSLAGLVIAWPRCPRRGRRYREAKYYSGLVPQASRPQIEGSKVRKGPGSRASVGQSGGPRFAIGDWQSSRNATLCRLERRRTTTSPAFIRISLTLLAGGAIEVPVSPFTRTSHG